MTAYYESLPGVTAALPHAGLTGAGWWTLPALSVGRPPVATCRMEAALAITGCWNVVKCRLSHADVLGQLPATVQV